MARLIQSIKDAFTMPGTVQNPIARPIAPDHVIPDVEEINTRVMRRGFELAAERERSDDVDRELAD